MRLKVSFNVITALLAGVTGFYQWRKMCRGSREVENTDLHTHTHTLTYLSDDGATSFRGNSWATEINVGERRSERMQRSSIFLQSDAVWGGRLCHWESTLGFFSPDFISSERQESLAVKAVCDAWRCGVDEEEER